MPKTATGLTAAAQQCSVSVLGQSFVGINVSGTWAGVLAFEQTFDGVKWVQLPVQVYPGGSANAALNSITSTGTNVNAFYFAAIPSGPGSTAVTPPVAVRARLTSYTSGTAVVVMASATDNSYIDCSLAQSVLNQTAVSSANTALTATQAANANHAWKLNSLLVSVSGTITAAHKVIVKDGTTALYTVYLPVITGGGNSSPVIPIPLPPTPLQTSVNAALNVVVDALDSGIISAVNMSISAA